FEDASGEKVPYVIKPRREGDAPSVYADPSRANRELNWRAELDLTSMCRDSWNYQKNKK
ncbi:MAG: GDP-mannose 4,6-dehydratase, partial [Alphaproteobacteria bacterium]|nr:GDP-mannose 4,6-dehydratase [Alphaproteobacteria bacterium]